VQKEELLDVRPCYWARGRNITTAEGNKDTPISTFLEVSKRKERGFMGEMKKSDFHSLSLTETAEGKEN